MTSLLRITAATAVLFGAGCNYEPCASESTDFQLLAPGDAIEIRVHACINRGEGDIELTMELSADGMPTVPLALLVDGILLDPEGGMQWSATAPGEPVSDAGCTQGKVITLRRIDTQPAVEYRGSLLADMSSPPRRSCSVAIAVTPL